MPAAANNTQTVNSSNAYVDLSIAAAFTTIPNLCNEPVGSQNTTTTACNALGAAAVSAINGSGLSPDQYFEGGNPLNSKNSFVPSNVGAQFVGSGYAPIFSQHKYNLFGRGSEKMGPLSREEHLFVQAVAGTFGLAVPQTSPGEDGVWKALNLLMVEPATSTSVNVSGVTFNIADISFYTDLTGISTGGRNLANAFCVSWYDSLFPGTGAVFCPILSSQQKADLYLTNNAFALVPDQCAGTAAPGLVANNCNIKDQWVDQVVVGYIESFDDPNNPTASLLKQNFRSQVFQDQSNPLGPFTEILTDFRLEQDVTLGQAAFEASRQTFQQTLATVGNGAFGTMQGDNIGQLITQDVEGWFYSCLNCDSTVNNVSHAFTPILQGMEFMPYTNTWRDLPSISHGASGGNLSTYAQAPGQPGP